MNHPKHFRNNLQTLRKESGMSMTKFSEQLDMSRSTVQSVLDEGQTTLDTACRIANALRLPLCTMTGGTLSPERVDVLHGLLLMADWYHSLNAESQKNIRGAFSAILDELEK